jgi:hypothetical protein
MSALPATFEPVRRATVSGAEGTALIESRRDRAAEPAPVVVCGSRVCWCAATEHRSLPMRPWSWSELGHVCGTSHMMDYCPACWAERQGLT